MHQNASSPLSKSGVIPFRLWNFFLLKIRVVNKQIVNHFVVVQMLCRHLKGFLELITYLFLTITKAPLFVVSLTN